MKALILAAGMGSRLGRPYPKPLTPLVNGRTIMQHQIENICRYLSRDDIHVVVGYKKELIMEAFPDLQFIYNNDFDTTNTSKSLMRALRKLRDDDVVWMNGDVVFDHAILQSVINFRHSAMVVNTSAVGEEEVKYRTSSEGWINEVSKQVKDALGEAVGINCVRQQDVPMLLAKLESCDDSDYFERGIEMAVADGTRFYPIDCSSQLCTEVDFAADLDRANTQLSERKGGSPNKN